MGKRAKKKYIPIFVMGAFYLIFVLNSCFSALINDSKVWKEVRANYELKEDEVIIVGSIRFLPPIASYEQFIPSDKEKLYRRKCDLFISLDKQPIEDSLEEWIHADLGKAFHVKGSKKTFYIQYGSIIVSYHQSTRSAYTPNGIGQQSFTSTKKEYMKTKLGFKADVLPDDQAVYIGNILIKRVKPNFLSPEYKTYFLKNYETHFLKNYTVTIIDDYDKIARKFNKKFNHRYKLRKSLLYKEKE